MCAVASAVPMTVAYASASMGLPRVLNQWDELPVALILMERIRVVAGFAAVLQNKKNYLRMRWVHKTECLQLFDRWVFLFKIWACHWYFPVGVLKFSFHLQVLMLSKLSPMKTQLFRFTPLYTLELIHNRHMCLLVLLFSPIVGVHQVAASPLLQLGGASCSVSSAVLAKWWKIQVGRESPGLFMFHTWWWGALPFQVWFHQVTHRTLNWWWELNLLSLMPGFGIMMIILFTPEIFSNLG